MDHTCIFNNTNPNWQDNGEYIATFIRHIENYLNDKLRHRGILFVNEAYIALGLEPTQEGQTHGWWLDVNKPNYPSQVRFRMEYEPDTLGIRISFSDDGEVHQHLTSEKVPA